MGFRITKRPEDGCTLPYGTAVTGGATMIWDPQNTWVRSVTDQDGTVLVGGKPVEAIYKAAEDEEAAESSLQ